MQEPISLGRPALPLAGGALARGPIALSQVEGVRRPATSRTTKKSAGKSKPSGRPRGTVPGGKALARLNLFLLQRGVAPELEGSPTPATAAAAPVAMGADLARGLVAGFNAVHNAPAAPLSTAAAVPVPQAWQPLGPYYMPHGQSYGKGPGSRPPVAGRVAAIAVDPSNDQHLLCGAAGGGVWESRDGGRTWAARTDDQPSLAIGALAFDPSNTNRVYAGTGEGDGARSRNQNVRAAGLLVSTNGGTAWTVMPGTTFIGVSFFEILVNPTNGNHLLAAATNGLYETTDGGGNWVRRRSQTTWSLSMHPHVPTNPAAGREVLAACADGLFRSTNGGTSWTAVPLPTPAGTSLERMEARHAPSNGSIAFVFAAYRRPGNNATAPAARVWRRSTFGGSFRTINAPADLQTNQAWYDWFAAVAPNNPDVLYLGAINAHRGVRQLTGTWSWKNISAKQPTGDSIHPDQHAIAFSPTDPNLVYIANDGGIYRSRDAGTSWASLNKGLNITEIEYLTQHPSHDAWLLAGTQDNGTIRYEGQQTWYHVQDGDGGDCGIDDSDPYTCFHSFYGPYLERSTEGGAWGTWQECLNIDEPSLFYPPLEVNRRLVVRGASDIWISRDAGDSWNSFALPGAAGYPSALAAPTTDQIYAGTTQGEMYRLDRSGSTWNVATLAAPAAGFISDLLVDPTSASDVWCTVNLGGQGRVFHSPDGGNSWNDVSTGIPQGIAIHCLEMDPAAAPASLFVGTDVGVFRTTDVGASWAPFTRGMPNILVKDLLLHADSRLLRAGTQARGVWEIALDAATMPNVHIYVRDHAADTGRALPSDTDIPSPFAKGTNLFWWQSPDIKVDASPFRVTGLDDLDFDLYSDDRSKVDEAIEFATGLQNEEPVRGQTVRVYVQAHNRGSLAAQNVAVRVFFVPGGVTWPDLPANFWQNFPANVVPADSPWQPVAPHKVIPRIDSGRSGIVGFNWHVPQTVGGAVGLLAVLSADNDSIDTTDLSIPELVRNSRYCALRNLAVFNPPSVAGPANHAVLVDVWPETAAHTALDFDKNGMALVKGLLLPKKLASAAKKAGWHPVKLTKADQEHLTQLIDARPEIKKQLDLKTAFHPGKGAGIAIGSLPKDGPFPVVLLLQPKAQKRSGSVILRKPDGTPVGGLTMINLAAAE